MNDDTQNPGSNSPQRPSCSCVINHRPAIASTSIMDCAEHGMPQTLQDTEYPGTAPKVALIISTPRGSSAVIAPLYDEEQVDQARAYASSIGYKVNPKYIPIYSLNDLAVIASSLSPGAPPPGLARHKPGCIYMHEEHPGECYVEPKSSTEENS